MTKIKAWITWPDESEPGWYHCNLLLENGWPIYGHFCSSPCFAMEDLWERRPERKAEWEAMELELEIVDEVPYSEVPKEVMNNNKAEAYVEFAKKYFPQYTKENTQPEIKGEVA